MGHSRQISVTSDLVPQIQDSLRLRHSWDEVALLYWFTAEIALSQDLVENGSFANRVMLLFRLYGLLSAAHSLFKTNKIGVLDELLVTDNLVDWLDNVECFVVLRLSEFILSLAIFGHILPLIIQGDILPINEAIEPSDVNFLRLIFTSTVIRCTIQNARLHALDPRCIRHGS